VGIESIEYQESLLWNKLCLLLKPFDLPMSSSTINIIINIYVYQTGRA